MKISQQVENNQSVFTRTEVIGLLNARLLDTGKDASIVAQQRFVDYCDEMCTNRKVHL